MTGTKSERKLSYIVLDVFTTTRLQGNPLAVFPEPGAISDAEMQAIANELNLSETVFLLDATRPEAVARARIFTPKRELNFAGHPTIGSAYVLAERHGLSDAFVIEENVGLVPIRSERSPGNGRRFWLTTPSLTFYETLDPERCARLLDLPVSDIAPSPARFVSAGSPLLCVHLVSVDAVDRARLNQTYLPDALGSVSSVGTFIFALKDPESTSSFDVYARMFAPQTGIVEDPATGGATGPLAGYMLEHGLLPSKSEVRFVSEQGTKMGRQSFLYVRVTQDENEPNIEVGGNAVTVAEAALFLDSH